MTGAEDLYFGVVRAAIAAHPRSQQKRIGPSELGEPCDRWILHKLAGTAEPERGAAWKPAVGTAMHDQLERWFDAANPAGVGGDVTVHEWVTESEVLVGNVGGTTITGHSDLFHVPTGTVIDHKVVGTRMLQKYRSQGPSERYRIQAHLYGKGFTDDGGWGPARHVAIAFLPRDGELGQAYFWSEPYNPHVALDALGRANRLASLLDVVGLDAALAAYPLCDGPWCDWCKVDRREQRAAGRLSLFDEPGDPTGTPTPAAAPSPSVKCSACGGPLPESVIRDGHTTHPTCGDASQTGPGVEARQVPSVPQPVAPVPSLFS